MGEGEVDPVRDIQIINDELRLKDLAAIEKPMAEMEKLYVRGNDKRLKAEFETLKKSKRKFIGRKTYQIPRMGRKGNGRFEQAFVLDCKTNDLFIEYGKEGLY